jgi:hypothetical protein
MSSAKRITRLFRWGVVPLATAFVLTAMWQPVVGQQGQPPAAGAPDGDQQGQEVLTRGPVHEAFGQPTVFNPKPGLAVPKKPPQAVEELPPDEKPEGENVSWIGGYWSWDEDRNDFIWVSGFWRVLPPNRQWMPGYWHEADGQFQWVSGYWAAADQDEQEFIAEAPQPSLDQGPPPTQPSDDHIWVPGTWVYHTHRYMWRPGYWIANQPGWVWIAAQYYWTPSGYCFVDGYWDYSIRRRGVLFAPCYFHPTVIVRPAFVYRPAICLDIDVITPHFFARPAYTHYYFGDYYARSYLSVGITPWFHFHYSRGAGYYSSDFAYVAAHYRRADPQWAINLRFGYERARDHVHYRPPRTYVQQKTIINNTTIVNNNTTIINKNTVALAKPLKDISAAAAKSGDAAPVKFQKITENQARTYAKTSADVRKIGQQRIALERAAAKDMAPGKTLNTAREGGVKRVSLPKSPVVSKVPTSEGEAGKSGSGKPPAIGGVASGRPGHIPPPIPGSERASRNKTPTGGVTDAKGTVRTPPVKPDASSLPGSEKTTRTPTGGDRTTRPLPDSGTSKTTPPTTIPPGKTMPPTKTLPGSTGGSDAGKSVPPTRTPPFVPKEGGSTGRPERTPPPAKPLPGSTGGSDAGKSVPPTRTPPFVPKEGGATGRPERTPPPAKSGSASGGSSGSGKSTPPPRSGSGSKSGGSSGKEKDKDKGKDR